MRLVIRLAMLRTRYQTARNGICCQGIPTLTNESVVLFKEGLRENQSIRGEIPTSSAGNGYLYWFNSHESCRLGTMGWGLDAREPFPLLDDFADCGMGKGGMVVGSQAWVGVGGGGGAGQERLSGK